MIGKDIREFQTTGTGETIKQGEMDDWIVNKLQSGKTWEGPINCSRKTGDFVALNSRVIPVSNNSNRSDFLFFSLTSMTFSLNKKLLSCICILTIIFHISWSHV